MAASLNFFSSFLLSSFLLSLLPLHSSKQDLHHQPRCKPATCGVLPPIGFPFADLSRPECGIYTINCTKSISTIRFEEKGKLYVVRSISYEANTITVQDDQIARDSSANICNSLYNFTLPPSKSLSFRLTTPNYTFLNCKRSHLCEDCHGFFNYSCEDSVLYYKASNQSSAPRSYNCSLVTYPTSEWLVDPYRSKKDLITVFAAGFALQWNLSRECSDCNKKRGECGWDHTTADFPCLNPGLMVGTTGGFLAFLCILFCFCHRKAMCSLIFFLDTTSKKDCDVEVFLQNCRSLGPRRYRYFELKRMTNSFRDKLGEGGYGKVYKGKLHDGHLVAVKMLTTSKCNGEEFINEVSSIGRTHHVNVVTLLGFCSEGSKRALIYEFMPNGSLEKFIYGEKPGESTLGFEKLCEIALGIARGLEYLHRGCSTRIVHLDIKPHNILLDGNFCPKISDFGLAKVSTTKESIISMMEARGTIGYTAPEIFCRNIGGVSSKSDVYSYGMMVLEMVGGRRNIEVGVVKTSEIYFPHWIYHRIELNHQLGLNGVTTRMEEAIARKMILVGLWCIQTDPANRPSTNKVVEMLEGSVESLAIPPKPYLSSPPRTFQNLSTESVS